MINLLPPQYQDDSYIYGSIDDVLLRMASNLSTDAAIINQVANYLASPVSAAISDAIRASGIQQLQTDMTMIQNDLTSLKTLFTGEINTSGNIFDTSLNVIDRAEAIVDTLDRLENYASDIIDHIDTTIDFISAAPEKIEETFNNFQNTLSKLSEFDVTTTLNKLPDLIADKILDIDVVKDSLVLLNNVQTTVTSVTVTISSIKAPRNLNDVRTLLSTLRSLVSQAKSVKAQADRVVESANRLKELLQSGNYLSLILSLASGGVTFFERPPSYNAQYPYNHGYRTHGGHVFEQDNTPGSQRLNYKHPAKTSIEIQPDGAVVFKGKSDFQLSVSKNFDVLIKNAATITVEGDARIIASNVTVEAKGNATVSSSGNTVINAASNASVVANGNVAVQSGGTCSVLSAQGTSISSNGKLTLSSNEGIDIITEGPITTKAAVKQEDIAGAVIKTNASVSETTAGLHKIIGKPITLN